MRRSKILTLATTLWLGFGGNHLIQAEERVVPPSGRHFHTLLEGDSLRRVAERLYGDAKSWPLLAEANDISDPETLRVGRYLEVPFREGQLMDRLWYRGLQDDENRVVDGCYDIPALAVAVDLDRNGRDEFLYLDPPATGYRWDEETGEDIRQSVDLVVADFENRQEQQRFRVLETDQASCLISILAYQLAERDTLVLIEFWIDSRTARANASSDLFFFLISDDLQAEHLQTLFGVSGIMSHSVTSGSSTRTTLTLLATDEDVYSFRVTTVDHSGERGLGDTLLDDTYWRERTEHRYRLRYDPKSRSLSCVGVRC